MKKTFLVMVAMLLLAAGARAQVTQFNIGGRDNSIVRAVDAENILIYTEDATGNGWFLLYHDGDDTARAFQLPTYFPMWVNDVRIDRQREAFFCGGIIYGGDTCGLVGSFKINDVFYSGGMPSYGWAIWDSTQWMHPTDFQRLKLFNVSGQVCMAMTGISEFDYGEQIMPTSVSSAWFDGSFWKICTFTHKNEPMSFTDIACLDNSIVAVGHGLYDSSCYIKTFRPALDFPSQPCYTNVVFRIDYGVAAGNVLVTQLAADTALLAVFDQGDNLRTILHRVEFDPGGKPVKFDAWVTNPASSHTYSSSWRQRELAVSDNGVWLLQQSAYPLALPDTTLGDWLLRFGLPLSSGTLSIDTWRPAYGVQSSIDMNFLSSMPWTSLSSPRLRIYHPAWSLTDNDCGRYYVWNVDHKQLSSSNHAIAEGVNYFKRIFMSTPTIISVSASVICNPMELE